MNKKFNYPSEPILPFEDAFPVHANGGGLARDWGNYSILTVHEVAALSFGVCPFAINSFLTDRNLRGTIHTSLWNSKVTEIIRAIHAGIIRKASESEKVTKETLIFTNDVEEYFISRDNKDTEKTIISNDLLFMKDESLEYIEIKISQPQNNHKEDFKHQEESKIHQDSSSVNTESKSALQRLIKKLFTSPQIGVNKKGGISAQALWEYIRTNKNDHIEDIEIISVSKWDCGDANIRWRSTVSDKALFMTKGSFQRRVSELNNPKK